MAVVGWTMATVALAALAGLGVGIQRAYADSVPVRQKVDVARFLPSGDLIFPSNVRQSCRGCARRALCERIEIETGFGEFLAVLQVHFGVLNGPHHKSPSIGTTLCLKGNCHAISRRCLISASDCAGVIRRKNSHFRGRKHDVRDLPADRQNRHEARRRGQGREGRIRQENGDRRVRRRQNDT